MATVTGESIRVVDADLDTCWRLLLDAAAYPEWYDTLDEVVVEQTDGDGRPRRVRVRADVGPLGSIRFNAELAYTERGSITGAQTGRGTLVKDVSYEWSLHPLAARRTEVRYRMSVASDGIRAAAAFRAAEALVRRDLIEGFTAALKRRAEAAL